MIPIIAEVTPLEIILKTIFYKYLTDSYCLTILSDQNFDGICSIFTKPLVFINAKEEENLAMKMLNASEMGCSDYIVQMTTPTLFMDLFEENIHIGNTRRSDRKLMFITTSTEHKQLEAFLNVLKAKGSRFVANILLIMPLEKETNDNSCQVYQFLTHKYVGKENNDAPFILDTWNSCTNDFETKATLFPYYMKNLGGKPLKTSTFNYKPYVLLDLDTNIVPTEYDGTEIRIIVEFCRWINCTIELIDVGDEQWGEIFENRTGNGIMGYLVEDLVDVGIGELDRADVGSLGSWYNAYQFLDFSAPAIRTGVTCLAPAPRLKARWELPILPFSWSMWGAVVITFMLATLALILAQHGSADRVLLTTFGILTTQSQPEGVLGGGKRYIIIWLLMIALVLDNAYGGGLASTLTVPKYEKSIDKVQDLVDANIEWGATHDAWIFSLLLSTEPKMVHLVNKFTMLKEKELHRRVFNRDMAYAIERLPGGHYAIGEYINEQAVPYVKLMDEDIYWEHCVTMTRKSSPYTKKYNELISRLQSSGLLLNWETQVVLQHSKYKVQLGVRLSQTARQEVELTALNMATLMGIFFLLAFGQLASILMFIGEIVRGRNQRKRPPPTFRV